MAFNSPSYLAFLGAAFLIFLGLNPRHRKVFLLIASYIFYGLLLHPSLLVVLALLTGFNFILAPRLSRTEDAARKTRLLVFGIIINLSFLIYFKYLPFFVVTINHSLILIHLPYSMTIPATLVSIALSFYIFQALSYLMDVYATTIQPETDPIDFALYLAYFPKLFQGPIERAHDFLPQLKNTYIANEAHIKQGILQFAFGFFKKMVVADRFAMMANYAYDAPTTMGGLPLTLATYAYALQIYFDFSGYIDMGMGASELFGLRLTNNFNKPYLARSCAEFWRRWHISLSRWIQDYLFNPLQMQFRHWGKAGTLVGLILTFILCGLWHGPSLTFICWGFLHGLFLAAGVLYRPFQKKLHKGLGITNAAFLKPWQVFATFNLVSFTYIFFRSETIEKALYISRKVLTQSVFELGQALSNLAHGVEVKETIRPLLLGLTPGQWVLSGLTLGIYWALEKGLPTIQEKPKIWRWSYYYALLASILYLGAFAVTNRFIYVQF